MKKLLLAGLISVCGQAMAVTITLPLSQEIDTPEGKTCIYENSQRSEVAEVPKGYNCPSVKTFNAG